ncbi:MAG TPA: PIG-L deacetylase family protein [Abditibacterium sp.]|jgi:LmbE family N-acetylglucosaminyl deacetylase
MNFSPLNFNNSLELSEEKLKSWGKTLAVAPHPDDEVLGCGGTLALLSKLGVETAVMWVSDGGASHPNSRAYPNQKLVNLREAEAKMALDKLGVGRKNSYFLRLPDGDLPFPGDQRFESAVQAVRRVLEAFEPKTLLLPWRRDPHRDHRAAWQLLSHASDDPDILRFEYLVWSHDNTEPQEWPQNTEASGFVVDVSTMQNRKKEAIAAHASQTTRLIKDDPEGFIISPETLANSERPYEAWIAPFCSIPEVAQRGRNREE